MKYEFQRLSTVNDGPLDTFFDGLERRYEGWVEFADDIFFPRFAARYVAYPVKGWVPDGIGLTPPQYWLRNQIDEIMATYWDAYREKKSAIAAAISSAVGNESITHKTFDAPNGDPDTSFVTAMETTIRTGGRPEELSHIQHLEALRNLDEEMVMKFEPLFLGVIA